MTLRQQYQFCGQPCRASERVTTARFGDMEAEPRDLEEAVAHPLDVGHRNSRVALDPDNLHCRRANCF